MRFGMCAIGVASLAFSASAQQGTRCWVVTDEYGARLVDEFGTVQPGVGSWTHNTGFSIPQTVALADNSGMAWVAEDLNDEALQAFQISGDGTPIAEFSVLGADFTAVAASRSTDRSAILYRMNNVLTLRSYTSESTDVEWSYDFPPQFTSADYSGVRISRDGSKICALVVDPTQGAYVSQLYTFSAQTGIIQSTWTYNDFGGPIDLTDDGVRCLVTVGTNALLVDTTTSSLLHTFVGSGGGARFKISGTGHTVALGGFSLYIVVENGDGSWTRVVNFSTPTSWFGWGTAVSRDGNTVAAMSHNYGNGYLSTATRIWDVPSATRIGDVYQTTGTGSFQDSISGAVLSDNGSVLAVSSWGTQDNIHPEVMIFDRNVHLIGSIDTPGSVFGLDMTGNGRWVLSGSKAVHANTFGNGGNVDLVAGGGCMTGDFDCNCTVDLSDLATMLIGFGLCESAPGYNAALDLNGNHCVDLGDLAQLLIVFGSSCGG